MNVFASEKRVYSWPNDIPAMELVLSYHFSAERYDGDDTNDATSPSDNDT